MKRKGGHFPGIVITVILTVIEFVFIYYLFNTRMIPQNYIMIAVAAIVLFMVILGFLVWTIYRPVRFVLGMLLAIAMSVMFTFGSVYVNKTARTLQNISNIETETSQIGIYVRNDDPAADINDTSDYEYGTLQSLDRENTDDVIINLEEDFGSPVNSRDYSGLSEMVDGLLQEDTDAIILNEAYLDVLDEMGYSDLKSRLRRIETQTLETPIQTEAADAACGVPENEKPKEENVSRKPSLYNNIYTVFISGIDNRGGLVAKSRSDVNIIATVNTDTKQVLLVSTPRDYFVPLSISGGVPDKLTHAGIYGINVCMDTLGMLYDTEINYYFRINFSGFVNVIDALGGITVWSDYDFDSQNEKGYHFDKGENQVSGEAALAFVTERYSFEEGDRQRGRNQMAVIKGVIDKALSPELLKNYSSILASLEDCFETNIIYEEIAYQLQRQLKDGGDWNIVSYSVDGTGDKQKPYSMSQTAYVMVPDYTTVDKAKELMEQVRNGEILSSE